MIVQEDVPYTKEEVKAMVKTIHDLREKVSQLGWHPASELPEKPTSKLGRIVILTLDGKLNFNYYVDGWDMCNVKLWCYPPKK